MCQPAAWARSRDARPSPILVPVQGRLIHPTTPPAALAACQPSELARAQGRPHGSDPERPKSYREHARGPPEGLTVLGVRDDKREDQRPRETSSAGSGRRGGRRRARRPGPARPPSCTHGGGGGGMGGPGAARTCAHAAARFAPPRMPGAAPLIGPAGLKRRDLARVGGAESAGAGAPPLSRTRGRGCRCLALPLHVGLPSRPGGLSARAPCCEPVTLSDSARSPLPLRAHFRVALA